MAQPRKRPAEDRAVPGSSPGGRIITSILLSSFITPFFGTALSIALPQLAREFTASAAAALGLLVVSNAAIAISVLPMGQLADVRGHSGVYRTGLLIALAGFTAAVFASSLIWLYAALATAGVGQAMIFASNNALLVQLTPPKRRASVIGLNSAAVYLGLVSGPLAGGVLTEVNWRLVFTPAIAMLTASYLLSRGVETKGTAGGVDVLGSLLWGVTVVVLILGVRTPALITLGLVTLCLTFLIEVKKPQPLVNPSAFRNPIFTASVIASFLNYLSTASLTPALSLLLQELYSMPSKIVGWVLSTPALAMAILAPIAGRVCDRVPPLYVASGGSAVLAGGLLLCIYSLESLQIIPRCS